MEAAASATELASTLVGGSSTYMLERELGRGASARVWLARDQRGRPTVLKLGSSRDRARVIAIEALYAGLALSPRLPELFDVGMARMAGDQVEIGEGGGDGLPCVALAWRSGEPLSTRLQGVVEGASREALALSLARDVGEALADLHDAGFAHGDVKPANVIVSTDGRATLVDLGLASGAFDTEMRGGSPRYLGLGDRVLGDARARDMLALGVVLVELVKDEVALSPEPLLLARDTRLGGPLGRIAAALLAPEPAARPSARWVLETAADAIRRRPAAPPDAGNAPERWRRSVRATYLRIRSRQIGRVRSVHGDVSTWAREAVALADRLRSLCHACGAAPPEPVAAEPRGLLEPIDAEQRQQWLAGLVGPAALDWASACVMGASERDLAETLSALASRARPATWSLTDVEYALSERGSRQPAKDERQSVEGHPQLRDPQGGETALAPLDAGTAAELALAVSGLPLDERALRTVERLSDDAPVALVLAAADALRLAGQLGRARSLVMGRRLDGAIAADILRRSGDVAQAKRVASVAIDSGCDRDDRARATLARILLDERALDEAAHLVDGRASAACAEVAALVEVTRGNAVRALEHAMRGRALATSAEAKARMSATIAFVKHGAASDPVGVRRAYRDAVEHAVRAGAILEEASYRTGVAAASVYLGELETAIAAATRAALLFEDVLGRPGMATRAWLTRAAAHAAIDARPDATRAAEIAIDRARSSGDTRAEAYACWALADAHDPEEPEGRGAALRAALLVELWQDDGSALGPLDDDRVHTAARLLRHAVDGLFERHQALVDDAAGSGSKLSPFCRLDWWGARAERIGRALSGSPLDDHSRQRARAVLAELLALADARAPVASHGKAMVAAYELAILVGDTDAVARADAARRRSAAAIIAGCPTTLAQAASAAPWTRRHAATLATAMGGEQALDLGKLVRSLGERDNLQTLLDRVVDVLLLWTGAERGLLLLKSPNGTLVPRSARNLSKADLRGEQLTVSTSLAHRALETAAPVVAVDAMEELSRGYESVHALKLRSVLALPLSAHGDTSGVVYLDDRVRRGAFGDRELAWALAVAPIAALAIADARAQVRLKRAVRRAERATLKLEQLLAKKETALDVAERELAKASAHKTRFRYDDIVGESTAVERMLALVDRVAPSDIPVLLRGESGSGKELVARAIHRASPRADKSFVGENCGALPETLLESALFGHVRGAFTGAHRPRVGLFEAADEGTLFLDEIGEMSPGMQTKLLRIIEDSMVRPVGSTSARKVDVRLITATHRDLEQMVAQGSFREDLYYRLNVITIPIPALRERADDIPLLVAHMIEKHSPRGRVTLTRRAREMLMRHPWPGNVRQLENEIRRALLMSDDVIDAEDLSIRDALADSDAALGLHVRARVDRLERDLVHQALERTGGNQTQAAKLLDVSRFGLHKMMKRLGIGQKET